MEQDTSVLTREWMSEVPTGRYVDGFTVEDLLPAQNAILDNVMASRIHGLFLLGAIVLPFLAVKVIKKFIRFNAAPGSMSDDVSVLGGGRRETITKTGRR